MTSLLHALIAGLLVFGILLMAIIAAIGTFLSSARERIKSTLIAPRIRSFIGGLTTPAVQYYWICRPRVVPTTRAPGPGWLPVSTIRGGRRVVVICEQASPRER